MQESRSSNQTMAGEGAETPACDEDEDPTDMLYELSRDK